MCNILNWTSKTKPLFVFLFYILKDFHILDLNTARPFSTQTLVVLALTSVDGRRRVVAEFL